MRSAGADICFDDALHEVERGCCGVRLVVCRGGARYGYCKHICYLSVVVVCAVQESACEGRCSTDS